MRELIIKYSTGQNNSRTCLRMIKNQSGVWQNCKFIEGFDVTECDYWVIGHHLPYTETVLCPKENIIYIDAEPDSVKDYNVNFLQQFAFILTARPNLQHAGVIKTHILSGWDVGAMHYINNKNSWNYDFFRTGKFTKTKVLSVISSAKQFTAGHKLRLNFTLKIKDYFKDKISVFGRGINNFYDSFDVIAQHKYHITLENCQLPDCFSEKLSNTFLCGAYPIYYGCPNIYDYFASDSLTVIDINDFTSAVETIERVIEEDYFTKAQDAIEKARIQVLDKYSIFPVVTSVINELEKRNLPHTKTKITLHAEEYFGPIMYKFI